MTDRYLLESGTPDGYLLEDGSGVLALDQSVEISNHSGTSVSYQGASTYRITKTGGTSAFDSDAVSAIGATGDFALRLQPLVSSGIDIILGVNSDPLTDSSYTSIDYSIYFGGGPPGLASAFESGVQQSDFSQAYDATTPYWIVRSGTTLTYRHGTDVSSATVLRTVSGVTGTLYFDSSFFTPGGSLDVQFNVVPAATSSLTPSLFTNSQTFFGPSASALATIAPAIVINSQSFFAATVTRGTVNLAPAIFTNGQSFFAPVAHSLYSLVPSFLGSTNSFFAPSVGRGAVNLSPSLFTNVSSFFAPAVARGTVSLSPSLFSDADSFFSATVAAGTVQPGLLVNANSFFAPALASTYAMSAGLYANSEAYFGPAIRSVRLFYPPLLANLPVFFRPKLVATRWQDEPNATGAWGDETAPTGTWTVEPSNDANWVPETDTTSEWADETRPAANWS